MLLFIVGLALYDNKCCDPKYEFENDFDMIAFLQKEHGNNKIYELFYPFFEKSKMLD